MRPVKIYASLVLDRENDEVMPRIPGVELGLHEGDIVPFQCKEGQHLVVFSPRGSRIQLRIGFDSNGDVELIVEE